MDNECVVKGSLALGLLQEPEALVSFNEVTGLWDRVRTGRIDEIEKRIARLEWFANFVGPTSWAMAGEAVEKDEA